MLQTFVHMRLGDGRVTLAIRSDDTRKTEPLVKVGVAFCSPRDKFTKAKGRKIALGRLGKGGDFWFEYQVRESEKEPLKAQISRQFLELVFERYLRSDSTRAVPNWVYKVVKHYADDLNQCLEDGRESNDY